jgi:hypothetical protein
MTLQDETALVAQPPAGEPDDGEDDPFAGIPLPEVTRRSEARRRRALRRRQRRRQVFKSAAAVAGGVALIAVTIAAWPHHQATPGHNPTAAKQAASAAHASPPVLIAQADAQGNAASLMLLVPGAKDKGGSIVLMPPGTMTEVASLGLQPLGQSLALGGAQRLQATVENLLGAAIGGVLVFDDAHLAQLVQPAGPLDVKVPMRVEQVTPDGQVNPLYEPGPHRLAPGDVPAFLSVKGQGTDLDRLVRHQAFFDAWLARMKAQPAAVPAAPPGLRKALQALLSGPVTTHVLPVRSLGTTSDGELYHVDQAELQSLVASVFPGTKPGAAGRPRVQVLNGTRALGLAQSAADKLVPAGVQVTLTGNAGRLDYDETQVVFYRPEDEAAAQRVQRALGLGRLVLSRNPIDVVDVTVIVGRDYQPQ